jgi:tRNA(fMet)-specific endonuclease VapC
MILLDTDHLSILTNARASAYGALLGRIEAAPVETFGVPVVAAEEQCRGWLAKIAGMRDPARQVRAYDQLAKLFDFLGNSLANDALLLSANLRDFGQVAGLRVENWLT